MNTDFEQIDHGVRSNDSQYGTFVDAEQTVLSQRVTSIDKGRRAVDCGSAVRLERLPFTVGIVDSEEMLQAVQTLRGAAYGHHLPQAAAKFGSPDPMDRQPAVTIFFAQDKLTHKVIGTARLQTNLYGSLLIEDSLTLPEPLQGRLLCEVTRLAVQSGSIPGVRYALVKAIHLFCIANQIGGVVVGSRRPLLRQYSDLGFTDLYGDERMVRLKHANDYEHRILFRDTVTSEAEARAKNHPNHGFVFRTYHPDIRVFEGTLYQSVHALGAEQAEDIKAA